MRHIANILCAISFALCLATLLCWVLAAMNCQRSVFKAQWKDHQTSLQLTYSVFGWQDKRGFTRDQFFEQWNRRSPQALDGLRQTLRQQFGPVDQTRWHWSALSSRAIMPHYGGPGTQAGWYKLEQVSFLKIAIDFAILPLLWLAWMVYRKWRKRGADPAAIECEACGYDMRTTPDRCPECGKVRGKQRNAAARSGP